MTPKTSCNITKSQQDPNIDYPTAKIEEFQKFRGITLKSYAHFGNYGQMVSTNYK